MIVIEATKESECCCSCHHNIRKRDEAGIYCECEIDGHYIGYVACFESVCDEYEEERSGEE